MNHIHAASDCTSQRAADIRKISNSACDGGTFFSTSRVYTCLHTSEDKEHRRIRDVSKRWGNYLIFIMSSEWDLMPVLALVRLTYLWHHFWQGIFQLFQKVIRVVAFLQMKWWTAMSQGWMCNNTMCRNCSVQLTTSLHKNDDRQSAAALHRSLGRSDSRRRRGARGNGLVPDKKICVSNTNLLFHLCYLSLLLCHVWHKPLSLIIMPKHTPPSLSLSS